MKTIKRFFELTCAAAVVAAEHLCQCAKCSCNFDRSKAKSSDAGCECPNCGTLLDEKGAAKVEDQAAKEKANDGKEIVADDASGDVDAKNATRQPALEAGGPGSGPHKGGGEHIIVHPNIEGGGSQRLDGKDYANYLSQRAKEATSKAEDTKDVFDHAEAKSAHNSAAMAQKKYGDKDLAAEHSKKAEYHWGKVTNHFDNQPASAANAGGANGLQAGYNGNQHQSSKELAAEHSVAADTASKVAASASKAARNQDPSNKEGMHDQAFTMHAAAKSLHELAAQKHRSAGDEDSAKEHDAAAAGHGNEMQAHKGVIEACGGMAARDYSGVLGLEASNPEGINQYSAAGGSDKEASKAAAMKASEHAKAANGLAYQASTHANEVNTPTAHRFAESASHYASQAHRTASDMIDAHQNVHGYDKEMAQAGAEHRGSMYARNDLASTHAGKMSKLLKGSDATPAAGLQLDCSACVEAKAAKTILNPIADGIIQYMPAGTHTITPSQNGRPVTVSVSINAGAADRLEQQRKALEASGKKPFFSVQHSTQIAAFWPAEFFWDTRLDATGSLVEGVWARGEWTRAGREAVEGKDFRTFSPTFFVDAIRNDPNRPVQVVCNDDAKANMGALENDPAFQTISPLWAHDASAPGTPKQKPAGVTTERLIVMVHDELRASNPDLQDVVNAISYKYDMRVSSNDVARALRGEALEAGGPGSGPHKSAQDHMHDAEEKAKAASEKAGPLGDKARKSGDVEDHAKALKAFSNAKEASIDAATKSHAAGYSDRGRQHEQDAEGHKTMMKYHAQEIYDKSK